MLGAVIGDIIGSPYEFDNHRSTEFPLFTKRSFFTDDTVLTIATAVKLLYGAHTLSVTMSITGFIPTVPMG